MLNVIGTSVALGVDHYSDDNNLGLHAKWGVSKKKILPKIKEMLNFDIPVTLSIGICRKDQGIHLYDWDSVDGDKYKFTVGYNNGLVSGHYVTVTGLLVDKVKGQTILEISTWGSRYYINYEEYINIVNQYGEYISSNIVYIKR